MQDEARCRITGIDHVGLHTANPAASADFYGDILGMEIVGGSGPHHPIGTSVFLSSRPKEESHEIAFFAHPAFAHVAFKVASLAELRSFHTSWRETSRLSSHLTTARRSPSTSRILSNLIEIYGPTGDLKLKQPIIAPRSVAA